MTGRRPMFTTEDAVTAALDIGISDFTMGKVAHVLGVTTPALYRVVPSRDALTVACLRRVFASRSLPEEDADWRDLLEGFAGDVWDRLLRYPGLDEAVGENPAPPPSYIPGILDLFRHLADRGFSRGQALYSTFRLLESATSRAGMLRRQLAYLHSLPADRGPVFRTPEGTPVTTDDGLAASITRQWWQEVGFFLDHMEALAPAWPEWAGPRFVPQPESVHGNR